MAEAALRQRHVATRLLDALLDLVFWLDVSVFRAHQTEHDHLALRGEAQRREIAGALVVIFEEKAVDLHLVEQNFRDRLIAALRHPGALEIAAAEMDRNHHVGRTIAY